MEFAHRPGSDDTVVPQLKKYKCKICPEEELQFVFELGSFLPLNQLIPDSPPLELQVFICKVCGIVQIPKRFSKEINFPPEYPFRSGITDSLKRNFESLVLDLKSNLGMGAEVLDIGANDGTLISLLHKEGFKVQGIEPTSARESCAPHLEVIGDFFENIEIKQTFDCIVLTNTFAHMDNPKGVLEKIKRILKPEGLLVIEVVDLDAMFEKREFDKFTHEHGFYFNSLTLSNFLDNCGFNIREIKKIGTHGGSLRVLLHKGSKKGTFADLDTNRIFCELEKLRFEISKISLSLKNLLRSNSVLNKPRYLAGATTRGVTLLKTLKVDTTDFQGILEKRDNVRVGSLMPDVNLMVLKEEVMAYEHNPVILILAWHISDEIVVNLKRINRKAIFIVPLPHPRIVS